MKNEFRCYVSGELLEDTFYLVSMQPDTDRVFMVSPASIDRIKDADYKVLVKKIEAPKR